jgi:hypothetical protein
MLPNDAIRTGITTSAAALVTALVALAQLSQMNGKLTDVQAKAYYRVITNPWISVTGLLALLSASFLVGDRSSEESVWWAIALFATGLSLISVILYRMYRWSMETNSGSMFSDVKRSYRCRVVNHVLHKDTSLTYAEKLDLVERHFSTLPDEQKPTVADLRYAVRLSRKLVLRLLRDGVAVSKSKSEANGVHDRNLHEKLDLFHTIRAIRRRTLEYTEDWFDDSFISDAFRLHSLVRNRARNEYYLLQQLIVEMLSYAGTKTDESRSASYALFAEAFVSGIKSEVELMHEKGSEMETHLFVERSTFIVFLEFMGRIRLHSSKLSLAYSASDDVWKRYYLGVFRQWVSEVVSSSSDAREDAFDSFLSANGEGVDRIHFGRLMVLYSAANSLNLHPLLVPRLRRIGVADGHVYAVGPGQDEEAAIREIAECRKRAANMLADRILAPMAGIEHLRELKKMIDEQIATGDPTRIKRLELYLRVLNERLDYLQSKS